MVIKNVIWWGEILKPNNEFVNNDSIGVEVELKSDGIDPTVERNNLAKLLMKPQLSTVHMVISPIPWEIKAGKIEEYKWLAVSLRCTKNYNFSEWPVLSYDAIKLLSFVAKRQTLNEIFSKMQNSFNYNHF